MKITKKDKQDFINTYKLWCFLAKTGKNKSDYPKIRELFSLLSLCAFCDYFHNSNDDACGNCPLKIDTPKHFDDYTDCVTHWQPLPEDR